MNRFCMVNGPLESYPLVCLRSPSSMVPALDNLAYSLMTYWEGKRCKERRKRKIPYGFGLHKAMILVIYYIVQTLEWITFSIQHLRNVQEPLCNIKCSVQICVGIILEIQYKDFSVKVFNKLFSTIQISSFTNIQYIAKQWMRYLGF